MRQESTTIETPDESYFASFTDMLVGILFIFIILLMIVANDFQEATEAVTNQKVNEFTAALTQEHQKAADEAEKALDQARTKELWKNQQDMLYADREKILRMIEQALKQGGMPVAIDVQQGVLRLPEHLLFSTTEETVNDKGKQALMMLAGVLETYLPCITPTSDPSRLFTCSFLNLSTTDGLDTIYIVDNPDSNRSTDEKWLLSVQRTISIFKELTYYKPYLDTDLRNTTGVPVMNVAAKKERRMLKQNDKNFMNMNKTVEFWFKMRSPTPAEIQKLKNADAVKK